MLTFTRTINDMDACTRTTMASWPWRIKRLGYTIADFVETLQIAAPTFTEYTSGRSMPGAARFLGIEYAIATMEKAKGLADGQTVSG